MYQSVPNFQTKWLLLPERKDGILVFKIQTYERLHVRGTPDVPILDNKKSSHEITGEEVKSFCWFDCKKSSLWKYLYLTTSNRILLYTKGASLH